MNLVIVGLEVVTYVESPPDVLELRSLTLLGSVGVEGDPPAKGNETGSHVVLLGVYHA